MRDIRFFCFIRNSICLRILTAYSLWRVIANLVPDLTKDFREAHHELARQTQV